MEETIYEYKIVLLGASNVGKTTFIHRKKFNCFKQNIDLTIGAFYQCITQTVNDKEVLIHLWDTAGQERYKSITPMYYRSADCVLLMFDLQDPKSLIDAKQWFDEIKECKNLNTKGFILVGTKLDLEKTRQIFIEDINNIFNNRVKYIEISSKDNLNIDLLDNLIVENIKYFIKDEIFKEQKQETCEITNDNIRYNYNVNRCCPIM